jgi:hypothetical protein
MKGNPILEDAWRIKDQLASEADYDIDRFFENLRKWEAEHPHAGPVIRNPEELRQVTSKMESSPAHSSVVLNDTPSQDKK